MTYYYTYTDVRNELRVTARRDRNHRKLKRWKYKNKSLDN
ncbi:hypothetical protein CCACVL1_02969 [Corchorus capsularis]|uniref:Uncharacterized protein n=1 Tax=Corchorus capsularis TaxID=210143 RepID=A0A1R3K4G2_COCAP|nr:hypothetical protein CCACVL1_02969 [Corchorus capsularis]